MNLESLEALTSEAAQKLKERVGAKAQVIISVFDAEGGSYYVHHVGTAVELLFISEISAKVVRDAVLPKPRIEK